VKVVSDTSPIFYLILIDASHLLPSLFGRIIIPTTVEQELVHPAATEAVRRVIKERPDWLEVRPSPPATAANDVTILHQGERDDASITRLQATNFRLDPALIDLVRPRSS
jgi:predicted nucleic acid-binding protein